MARPTFASSSSLEPPEIRSRLRFAPAFVSAPFALPSFLLRFLSSFLTHQHGLGRRQPRGRVVRKAHPRRQLLVLLRHWRRPRSHCCVRPALRQERPPRLSAPRRRLHGTLARRHRQRVLVDYEIHGAGAARPVDPVPPAASVHRLQRCDRFVDPPRAGLLHLAHLDHLGQEQLRLPRHPRRLRAVGVRHRALHDLRGVATHALPRVRRGEGCALGLARARAPRRHPHHRRDALLPPPQAAQERRDGQGRRRALAHDSCRPPHGEDERLLAPHAGHHPLAHDLAHHNFPLLDHGLPRGQNLHLLGPRHSQLSPLDERHVGRVLRRARHVALLSRVQGVRRSLDGVALAAPVGAGPHRGGDARRRLKRRRARCGRGAARREAVRRQVRVGEDRLGGVGGRREGRRRAGEARQRAPVGEVLRERFSSRLSMYSVVQLQRRLVLLERGERERRESAAEEEAGGGPAGGQA